MPRSFAIVSCFAVLLAGCATPLRSADGGASPLNSNAELDGRLVRCSALGPQAQNDSDCISAFAEARRRILPAAREK